VSVDGSVGYGGLPLVVLLVNVGIQKPKKYKNIGFYGGIRSIHVGAMTFSIMTLSITINKMRHSA
jgi:hypothetical protein